MSRYCLQTAIDILQGKPVTKFTDDQLGKRTYKLKPADYRVRITCFDARPLAVTGRSVND